MPDDVVLIQIGAGLDFNHADRDLSGVGQRVARTQWHIGRLVFGEQARLTVDRYFHCAGNDDPVLGPVEMALQAELFARLDHHGLNRKPA